jgi:pSer/pThr/pTyr-binding forkhead associated (FHA) protein
MSNTPRYDEPSWSAAPMEKFQLEVLKDGSIVATVDLDQKAYYTLGRQPDIVDIVMDHPSISRMHAVLNFRDDGALMLRDLGSAQGTQLNKQLCDKNTYYRVYVGDMIKFGASTRKYIVLGPETHSREEYNSAGMETYRTKLAERSAEIQAKLDKEEERNAFSWGMREDAEPEAEEEDDGTSGERDQELPEYLRKMKNDENFDRKYGEKFKASIDETEAKNAKDAEVMEKIRKKERKIQNMQEENRRIYLKEGSQENGLTEGQMAAVARNDKAITALETEVEDLIRQIRAKAGDRGLTGAVKKAAKANDDETDMIDLTEQTADSSTNWRLRKKLQKNAHLHPAGAETSEPHSLTYVEIQQQLLQRTTVVAQLEQDIKQTEAAIASQQSVLNTEDQSTAAGAGDQGGDQIDAVLARDRLQEHRTTLRRLQNDLQAQHVQQRRLQVLLKAATPALSSLVSRNAPSVGAATAATAVTTVPVAANAPELVTGQAPPPAVTQEDARATTSIPPVSRGTVEASSTDVTANSEDKLAELERFIEQEKAAEVLAAAKAAALKADREASGDKGTRGEARHVVKAVASSNPVGENDKEGVVGGKRAPTEGGDASQPEQPAKRQYTATRPPTAARALPQAGAVEDTLRYDSKRLEGGETAWAPPVNQKGDGRTALNDKFGY